MDYVGILLDESGSMAGERHRVPEAVENFIAEILDEDPFVAIYSFNSHNNFSERYKGYAEDFQSIKYHPTMTTALYDSIARIIHSMEQETENASDKVVIVIDTDGEDTDSQTFNMHTLAPLIKAKKEAGWEFLFFASGEYSAELKRIGDKLGIKALGFSHSSRQLTYQSAGEAVKKYFEGEPLLLEHIKTTD